jgi:mRNA interferase MazF
LANSRKTLQGTRGALKGEPAAATVRKSTAVPWVPDRAEVIWIQHSPAVGHEIPELHPMLVVSTRAFNERTGLVIGFPMTHSEAHEDNPFAIPVQGSKGKAYILAHQPKSFDWRVRSAKPHPFGPGYKPHLEEALAILAQICGMETK